MVVTFDKQTGDPVITLPEGCENYKTGLEKALFNEFAFEPLNKMVLSRMNRFAEEWLHQRGVNINPGEKEE